MPSVTQVIDYCMEPELFNWHQRLGKTACKKIGDEAKRVGTAVDALVQQDIRDGGYLVPEGDSPIENCMKGWEKFKKDYPLFVGSVKEMQTELVDGDLVGHPDFINVESEKYDKWAKGIDWIWGVTDLKCSSGIRPRYWTQTAKYSDMKKKDFNNYFPSFIAVIRLDKTAEDGAYEYQRIKNPEVINYEIKVFEAYLTAFRHNENVREIMRQQLENEVI